MERENTLNVLAIKDSGQKMYKVDVESQDERTVTNLMNSVEKGENDDAKFIYENSVLDNYDPNNKKAE